MSTPPPSTRPCPCGSGHLFREGCEDAYRADVSAWQTLRALEASVVPKIASFVLDRWGPDVIAKGIVDFTWPTRNHSVDVVRRLAPLFDSWFLFSWVPDRHEDCVTVPIGWPRKAAGEVWLNTVPDVTDPERAFVLAATEDGLLHSPLLIESVTPGWMLTVRDLLTGRRFRIVDPEISERAQPDEVLLSAIVKLDGRFFLLGAASHALPGDCRFELRESRQGQTGDPWLPRRFWIGYEFEIFSEYCDAYERRPVTRLAARGEVADPVHLRWQVAAPFVEVLDRLRPLTACYGDEEALDEENGPDGEPHMLLGWYEAGDSGDDEDWEEIGYLYLDEGWLAADLPAPALADRLVAEVARVAGDVTTLVERRPCVPTQIHDRPSTLLLFEAIAPAGPTPTTLH